MRSALNIHVIRTEAWLYRALFCFCFLFASSYLRIHHFTNGCIVPLEKTRFSIWRNLKGGKCSCCVYLLSMETSHCDSVMVKVANCPRHIRSLFSGFEIRTFPCYLTASVLSNHKTIKDFDHQRLSRTQSFMFIQNGPIPTFRISVFLRKEQSFQMYRYYSVLVAITIARNLIYIQKSMRKCLINLLYNPLVHRFSESSEKKIKKSWIFGTVAI